MRMMSEWQQFTGALWIKKKKKVSLCLCILFKRCHWRDHVPLNILSSLSQWSDGNTSAPSELHFPIHPPSLSRVSALGPCFRWLDSVTGCFLILAELSGRAIDPYWERTEEKLFTTAAVFSSWEERQPRELHIVCVCFRYSLYLSVTFCVCDM